MHDPFSVTSAHRGDNVCYVADPWRVPTNGGRSYSSEQLDRRSFIRRARGLGFSLSQVRGSLRLSDQRRRSCEAVDAIAREHLAEVDRKIADLAALRRELDSIMSQCGHGTVAECRIIEALSPGQTVAHQV
jgi:DNA-binding transcriptional MerR regulator